MDFCIFLANLQQQSTMIDILAKITNMCKKTSCPEKITIINHIKKSINHLIRYRAGFTILRPNVIPLQG